jgi:serine/threonine-protein kinase
LNEHDAADPLIGRTIGDAYVVQQLVGVGGMGRVYRAEQRALSRVVAIKVVHRHLLGDRDSISRFYTEARAASSLNHPNSVSVFDFGRTDDGVMYLVMEYLRGKDLARIMHEEGPLPLTRIIEIGIGVLGALGEAHARGVVHRDLKPENIIIERLRGGTDLVKVVDFGLAKVRGIEPAEAARGLVAGTPDYMAPEQARALEVDGRSDLYALGVVLFELLSGRLPFIDDTPAKVMTRHVMEAPPNPAQIAPYRGIPESFVEVVLKALAKEPKNRFSDADDMTRALMRAGVSLRTTGERARCPSCGAMNETRRAFCGDCGRRLSPAPPSPLASVRSKRTPSERRLLGREKALRALLDPLERARTGLTAAYLTGELGLGKTRFLQELGQHAEREGSVVVHAGPHPSGALVAYGPIRQAVAALLNVPEERLLQLAEDEALFRPGLARAGMFELITPEGVPGREGVSRHQAVAAAVARAFELAATRATDGRIVLLVDDVTRCDGLSADVLVALPQHAQDMKVLVVMASHVPLPLRSEWVGAHIVLEGVERDAIDDLLSPDAVEAVMARGALPLYLEQLRALHWEKTQEEPEPPSLAECVMRRLALLDLGSRRVLQAVAVLGERVQFRALERLVDAEQLAVLSRLCESGFLNQTDDGYEFTHPYLRDLAAASTPAETRKILHASALEFSSQTGEALEVRAEHAFRSGDVITALMLLERAGQEGLKRGDPAVALVAFRHGLELARRTLLETGDEALDPAIVSFSRQLGESMLWSGQVTGAAGVLNEAFQLAGPSSLERARMTMLLGRVAERRDKPREAARQLGLAAELAHKLENPVLEARSRWALSRVRKAEGDTLGAVNALTAAAERLIEAEPNSARRAQVELELGELLVDMGDIEAATDHLERALDLARDGDWAAIAAGALGVLASIDELSGQRTQAGRRYREATRLAAGAGDAKGHERWRRAAATLAAG